VNMFGNMYGMKFGNDTSPQQANATPCTDRELAQLRQIARSLVCVHPENDRLVKMLHSDGYIEYCPHCMRITDIYEP
jgi:hypothetical protein